MDGKVHTLPKGMHNYSTFSLWDTYRALHPVYTLLLPERVPDFVNCLSAWLSKAPRECPVWPLQGRETGMHGRLSLCARRRRGHRKGLSWHRCEGCIRSLPRSAPSQMIIEGLGGLSQIRLCSVRSSRTSPPARRSTTPTTIGLSQHWPKPLVKRAIIELLMKRSKSFANLYDKESGFIRPRYADGHWAAPFNPKGINITRQMARLYRG